jgi:hypothetical protein
VVRSGEDKSSWSEVVSLSQSLRMCAKRTSWWAARALQWMYTSPGRMRYSKISSRSSAGSDMRLAVFDGGWVSSRPNAPKASSMMRVGMSCPLDDDTPKTDFILRGGVWRQADDDPEKLACIIAIASLGDAPSLLI